jgi:predicted outer membrane lipoprotein
MEMIFEAISSNPGYFAWAFGIVNALWIVFLYFNKKQHERELIRVKQSFDLDLERRKKVFEMKASQYESYFKHIDTIHNRHQTDYQDIFLPIMNQFMSDYLSASNAGDKHRETQATIAFSEKISRIQRDGFKELGVIESETNSLRLTASDEVAALLDEIKELYERLFVLSGKMMSDLVDITINNNQQLANENQAQIVKVGEQVRAKAATLREAMRNDLKQI